MQSLASLLADNNLSDYKRRWLRTAYHNRGQLHQRAFGTSANDQVLRDLSVISADGREVRGAAAMRRLPSAADSERKFRVLMVVLAVHSYLPSQHF